jgi:large subunit ribosomal protein L3
MISGIWGKKVGMTQLFSENKQVVPVTMIDVSDWRVTQVKTKEHDGYSAVQLSKLRPDYTAQEFSIDWLKQPKKYFDAVKEVSLADGQPAGDHSKVQVGQVADVATILTNGENVDVVGITIGRGFQGAVKRHGFTGGRASHGDKLGRKPGSLSYMRRQGRVTKGKRMPGHMGVEQVVVKNLQVIKVEPSAHIIFVKGSVPGKSGSLVFVRKRG